MNGFGGTAVLVRLALRRDRILAPAWIAVFVALAATSAAATAGLFPTRASITAAASAFNTSPALVALYGRIYDEHSLGAVAMLKAGGTGALMVGLVAIVLTVRHTRAEEEAGRLDLLGAGTAGRHAPVAAALITVIGVNAVLGALTTITLVVSGLPAAGSLAFGAAWAGVGACFAAIAAVTAQFARTARTATALAVTVLGAVYLIRALGDLADADGPRWLSWLSPFGWSQQFRPYAGERWWVLLITVAFTATALLGAFALAARRDIGTGLLAERAGSPVAGWSLRGPLGLAWRLHRGGLLGWIAGFALLGLVLGGIASTAADFLDNPSARALFAALGGDRSALTDMFLAAEMSFVGVFAAGYGIQAVLHARREEADQHADLVLATPVSRIRWAGSHLLVALTGTTAVLAATGFTAGIAHAAQTGDGAQLARLLAAALAQLPAAWVLTTLTFAAFGLGSQLAVTGWVMLTAFVLIAEIGPLLDTGGWLFDLSPFTHTPKLPGADVSATPLIWLTVTAAVFVTAGLAALRRRDIT